MNVVSLPVEHRMLLNPYDDEQIARRAATSAGVAFARDAYALAIARARFDSNFERLSNADQALSVAVGTLIHDLAGSMTSWACHVELHAPAGLGYLPGAFAIRTLLSRSHRGCALAHRTQLLARDIQFHHRAADRLPESNRDLILEISSRFGTAWLRASATASRKDVRKYVAKSTTAGSLICSGTAAEVRKIKAAKVERNALSSTRAGAARLSCARKASGAAIATRTRASSAKRGTTSASRSASVKRGARPAAAARGRARTAPGATKRAVLKTLASGDAMTAGEVANATGLGRASVSTTLSKLSKAGEVTKAARGYKLAA